MNLNAITMICTVLAMVLGAVALLLITVILFSVGLRLIDHANELLDEKKMDNKNRIVNTILGIITVLSGSFMVILGIGVIIAIIVGLIILLT